MITIILTTLSREVACLTESYLPCERRIIFTALCRSICIPYDENWDTPDQPMFDQPIALSFNCYLLSAVMCIFNPRNLSICDSICAREGECYAIKISIQFCTRRTIRHFAVIDYLSVSYLLFIFWGLKRVIATFAVFQKFVIFLMKFTQHDIP